MAQKIAKKIKEVRNATWDSGKVRKMQTKQFLKFEKKQKNDFYS